MMTRGPANNAGRCERERSTRMANRPRPAINPRQPPRRRSGMIFDNQIVDDARGRARDHRFLVVPGHDFALEADLVMAPARSAGDAGSIPDGSTYAPAPSSPTCPLR